MFKTIVKKEVQNNISSFKFFVIFLFLIILIPLTFFFLSIDYSKKADEYSQRQIEIENFLKNYAHFNRIGAILNPFQPPIPFHSMIRGISEDINLEFFDNDPIPIVFPLIDFTFIVSIFLSLAALILSYDSISGEREDLTLSSALSNSISRSRLILGKIAGGIITLLIPFFVSLLIGLLIISFNSKFNFNVSDWISFLIIIIGAIIYISIFYCIGIFISSKHRFSSSSILTSLFFWVLFVFIIPNISPYITSFIMKMPSYIKVQRETSRITDVERDELGRKLWRKKEAQLYKKYPFLKETPLEKDRKERAKTDLAFRKAMEEYTNEWQKAWEEANRIQNEKADKIWRQFGKKQDSQIIISGIISLLSPLSNFTYLASDLSSTGIRNMIHFARIGKNWAERFREYAMKKVSEFQKNHPAEDPWNTFIDMSDRPKFSYNQEELKGRLLWCLPFFSILIIFLLIFFISSYISFIKYDVR
ncbi:MAG: ABC transporter permease [Acidobacteriota bacterium]